MPGARQTIDRLDSADGSGGVVRGVHYDAAGRLRATWRDHNIALNGGRSAFARFMVDDSTTVAAVRLFWFGSGSAALSAQSSAAQYALFGRTPSNLSKATSLNSAIGPSGFTARFWCVIGPNEFTGTIREMLTTTFALAASPRHARVLVNGGTGRAHNSGDTMLFTWDFVVATGEQPF